MTVTDGPEAGYRRLLRSYPRRWRHERGEELLAVLLAAAQASGRRRPTAREAIDLIRNGLATRLREAVQPFSLALRARVATLSLAGGAAMALVCLVFGELPPSSGPSHLVSYQSVTTFGPFLTVGGLLYLGWLVAVGLTVAGRLRPGTTTGVLLLGGSGAVAATSILARTRPIAAPPLHLALLFAALSLLTCLGRVELTRAGRALLALAGTAFAGVLAGATVLQAPHDAGMFGVEDPRWVFYRGWQVGIQLLSRETWILLLAGLVTAALASRWRPGWFTASVIAGLPWLYFALLFAGGGNVANLRLPVLTFGVLGFAAGLAAIGYRAGIRAGAGRLSSRGQG